MKYFNTEAEAEAETHVVDYSAFSHPLGLDGVKAGLLLKSASRISKDTSKII